MTSLELFAIGVIVVIFIISLVLNLCCAHHILRSMENDYERRYERRLYERIKERGVRNEQE